MASAHDEKHRARRGSECQIQLYVNSPERRKLLDEKVLAAVPTLGAAGASRFDWRSPLLVPVLPGDHPFHEYRDGKVFDAMGMSGLRERWRDYWPSRSQKWDALAVAYGGGDGVVGSVLVEAKSYPGEFQPKSGGSAAKGDRLSDIHARLRETRAWLGVEESSDVVKQWEGPLYQSANRFATLRFFRDFLKPPVDAWLVNVYLVNDRTHTSRKLATSKQQWTDELSEAERALGLEGKEVPHSGRVFLEAGTYVELVAATGG